MEEEAPFTINNEKYSMDIIFKYQTPNGISKKGITIYKKNCEINFLNEESLNESNNNKEKEKENSFIILSYANIGFISISNIICFLYLTKDDIILLNNKKNEEYIYYKVKNVHYIIMNDKIEEIDDQNFKKNFEQFKIFFISENLYFSFCKYGNNILNHHIYSSNNFFYNEKYISLFQQSNAIEFITPLNKGIYKYFIIKNNNQDNQNNKNSENNDNNKDNINNEEIEFIEITIKITNKINKNENNIIKIEDIINEKECFQEIKVEISSNIINEKIIYIFYSYYGKSCSNIDILYSLINNDREIKNGLLLTVFDYVYDKEMKKEDYKKILKSSIKNEKIKDLFDIIITNDGKKNNIKKFVFENIDKIKNIFDKKEENNINENLLIISGTSDNSILNLSQEIIDSIIYFYFNNFINKENNYNDFLINKVKLNIDNYYNIIDELNGKRMMKLLKLNLPKISYINKNYIQENIKKNKKKIFNIFILTYNVCGMSIENINSINFSELLFPIKVKEYFESYDNKKDYPIFYCIGLEEVINLNPKNVIIGGEKEKYILWEEKIKIELKSKDNYVLLSKINLVGILFFIFVKASEISKIKNIKKTKIKTGFYGQLGNKGSCFVEFEYEKKTYGLNSGHLTSGEKIKNNNERKNALINILNHKLEKDSIEFYINDFYFILGDLNFRVQNNIKIIHNWLFDLKFEGKQYFNENSNNTNNVDNKNKINSIKNENNDIESNKNVNNKKLNKEGDDENIENIFYQIDEKVFMKYFGDDYWKFDQLNMFKEELIKYNIKESEISFFPTYKYIKKTNSYNLLKREPSWTDRILFKDNKFIKSIIYDRINVHYSDHKPVFSLFEINY